jgi:hypothetical protein
MAAKKATSTKAKKPKAGTRAKKPAKKTTAKRAKATSRSNGLDRSVDHFRKSLERSVTLSRDRLQDVVDDAVKRGRITRGDAEKMLSELVNKGRRQTDSLLKELERLVKQVRKEVSGRGKRR